jgi:cell division septum initiation protein DivIVA
LRWVQLAWLPIKCPNAIWDEDPLRAWRGRCVSDAEVAVVPATALALEAGGDEGGIGSMLQLGRRSRRRRTVAATCWSTHCRVRGEWGWVTALCVPRADRTVAPSLGGMLTKVEHGVSAGEETSAVARLLEIAAHNADELLGEARAEAASIVAKAHSDADRLTGVSQAEADQLRSSARAEADRVLAAAQEEAERVHAELEQTRAAHNVELDRHRRTVLGDLAEQQAAVEAEVARLQQLERDHRDRMRGYLTQQLEQLEEIEPTTPR